jgi:two-component system NtrC family sensor kinase
VTPIDSPPRDPSALEAMPLDGPSPSAVAALLRERDHLFLLHEALAEVEGARTASERLDVLVCALRRIGYERVEVVHSCVMPPSGAESTPISNSTVLDSGELIVPMRAIDGTTVATLVLAEPAEQSLPTLARVRTIELFAQQTASIVENARLYAESQRERGRGEALSDIARAVGSSLHLDDVMQLSLRHAAALLQAEGATLGLLRDDQVVVVAAVGAAEPLIGFSIPIVDSSVGLALRDQRAAISNEISYTPAKLPVGGMIERALVAPLISSEGSIGALAVINRHEPFGEDDAAVLQRLADQVAVAVSNARLYEESRSAADRYRKAIEDERRARDAVGQSEARYRNLFETATDAIYTLDAHGTFTSVNEATCTLCGQDRAELLGRSPLGLFAASDIGRVKEHFKSALAGVAQTYECQFVRPDGTRRFASVTNSPIRHGPRVIGVLGVVRDITDEKRMAEQLLQQEKLAAVGQLVSGVAHELNNPLASVLAFAQLLLAAPPDAPHDRRAVDAIHQEAKRAAKIVANLLTFARQHQPERTITDLNRVVEDTLELRRYALRVAQIEIDAELDPHLPITWADPFQLQQVILNLITNAEHALSNWDGPRRILVTSAYRGGELLIAVADTGPGIAAENLSRIFNPFFTTKPVGEGTGLGLSISDGIVREHGGRIRVDSTPDHGAVFTIELPLVAPPSPDLPIEIDAAPAITPAKRLLIVDDEPAIRSAVISYFESLGHLVDAAATGREAIARLEIESYDALLLDLRLPDVTGDAVLRDLERAGLAPERVIFLTGDTQSESAREILSATGRPVVSKPFELDELAQAVLAEERA